MGAGVGGIPFPSLAKVLAKCSFQEKQTCVMSKVLVTFHKDYSSSPPGRVMW